MNGQFSTNLGADPTAVTQPVKVDEYRALPPRKRKLGVKILYRSTRTASARGISRANLSRTKTVAWKATTRPLTKTSSDPDMLQTAVVPDERSTSSFRKQRSRQVIVSEKTARKEKTIPVQTSSSRAERNLQWYIVHQQDSQLSEAERELFGTYVRLVRKTRGWTRTELADKAQLSVDTLTALEHGIAGEDQIGAAASARLCQTLGISFNRFFERNQQILTILREDNSEELHGTTSGATPHHAIKNGHAHPG